MDTLNFVSLETETARKLARSEAARKGNETRKARKLELAERQAYVEAVEAEIAAVALREAAEIQALLDAQTPVATDYLMWVGSQSYPTVDDYVKEARTMGCCKRIGKMPKTVVPGKSRVFLAHDDGLVGEGFVFGYFVINQVEILAQYEEDIPENLKDKVVPVDLNELKEEERMCGQRDQVGALYLVSERVPGALVEFAEVRSLNYFDDGRKHFRGALRIEYGDMMVEGPTDSLMEAPSRTAVVEPHADTWTEDEDEALMVRFFQLDSKSKVAQETAYQTGRAKPAVLRHLTKVLKANGYVATSEEGGSEE